MKPSKTNPLFARFFRGNTLATAVVVSLVTLGSLTPSHAGDLYWDTNADAPGSGNAGGTWDSGTNWTTDATGAVATVGWTDGENVIFSAGTDGTAAKTVTLGGTVKTPSILLDDISVVTLANGGIDITGGTTIDTSILGGAGGRSLIWNPVLSGAGNLTLKVNGDTSDTGGGSDSVFALIGANTFTGNIRITAGTVRINSGFGDAANKIILDGGALIDNNLSLTTSRNIEVGAAGGVIRLWGSSVTNLNGTLSNEAGVASTWVKHTDGGSLYLKGSGANFTGQLINARGNMYLNAQDWANADVVLTDGGNVLYIPTAGDTNIKSLASDRDIQIYSGARLNIISGTFTAKAGNDINNFWVQNSGKITSQSGTLTLNWDTHFDTAGDQSLRVIVDDYNAGTPLTVVKNGPGGVNNYDKANTYTGGTIINLGRISASNAKAFGTGTVTVNSGGQAYLSGASNIHTNNFVINGPGATENYGVLGAIRLENNTQISGSVTVGTGGARIAMSGTPTGIISGALLGNGNLEINSTATTTTGTLNFTGNTSGYTGTLILNRGVTNVGTTGLGGGLSVISGTANIAGPIAGAVNVTDGTASISGTVGGGFTQTTGTTTIGGLITGDAAVNGGTAILNGGATGNVTVADGATLGGEGSIAGSLTLGGATGATLRIGGGTTAALSVDSLSMDPAALIGVALDSLPTEPGPFVVLDYNTLASGDENNFVVPTGLFRGDPQVQHDTDETRFTLELDSQVRTWNAAFSTDWNATDLNWDEGDQVFFTGDQVVFANNGAGTVNLVGTLAPMSITFGNAAGNDFILSGTGNITGSAVINKNGVGNVSLGGANTFTGAINVNTGVLTAGSATAFGKTSGINVAAGAAVNLNGQGLGNNTNTTWTIIGDGGDGAGGLGAVFNTGGDVYEDSSIKFLTLAGDAEIGGNNGRFDVGRDGVTTLGGLIDGKNFTLTKTGTCAMVFRGPAKDITYQLNQGQLTFEDYDSASGTNPITVNAGRLGTYGNRTIGNNVNFTTEGAFLVCQAFTGTWTGEITVGANTTFQADGTLVVDGKLIGTGNITKGGGSVLALQADASGFSGKVTSAGGTLRLENSDAAGTYTGTDWLTLNGGTVELGTIASVTSGTLGSASRGITQTANVSYNPGAGNTLTLAGKVAGTGNLIKPNNTADGREVLENRKTVAVGGRSRNDGGLWRLTGTRWARRGSGKKPTESRSVPKVLEKIRRRLSARQPSADLESK